MKMKNKNKNDGIVYRTDIFNSMCFDRDRYRFAYMSNVDYMIDFYFWFSVGKMSMRMQMRILFFFFFIYLMLRPVNETNATNASDFYSFSKMGKIDFILHVAEIMAMSHR